MAISTEALFNEGISRKDLLSFARRRPSKRSHTPTGRGPVSPPAPPQPPDWNPLHHLGRRGLIIGGIALGVITLALKPWGLIFPSGGEEEKQKVAPQKEANNIPDLGLRIDENGFFRAARATPNWEILPDATDKSKLSCPGWSPNVCRGKSSSSFKVAFNRPMAEFMFNQSKLTNPPIRTNIIFVEDWGQDLDSEHGQGGFTGITQDEKEQSTVIFLKRAAWQAFQAADKQNLPVQDYFQGLVSRIASAWVVHEFGHAGAETKALYRKGKPTVPAQYEATHPQVFDFQNQYDKLYDQAAKQGLVANALVVALEPTVDLNALRAQIFQEARQKGFE